MLKLCQKNSQNVIMLDLNQKGLNYARIMLKIVSVKSLCQNYARQVLIMPVQHDLLRPKFKKPVLHNILFYRFFIQ